MAVFLSWLPDSFFCLVDLQRQGLIRLGSGRVQEVEASKFFCRLHLTDVVKSG